MFVTSLSRPPPTHHHYHHACNTIRIGVIRMLLSTDKKWSKKKVAPLRSRTRLSRGIDKYIRVLQVPDSDLIKNAKNKRTKRCDKNPASVF